MEGKVIYKVGRSVNWRMRERNIFNSILERHNTLPRLFAVMRTCRVTLAENRLVDSVRNNNNFAPTPTGLEWFLSKLEATHAEMEICKMMTAAISYAAYRITH